MAILTCKGLSKRFGGTQALDQVDLSVEPGHVGNGFGVLHHHHHRGLLALAGGGPGAGLQNGVQFLVFDLLRLVFTDAAAFLQYP